MASQTKGCCGEEREREAKDRALDDGAAENQVRESGSNCWDWCMGGGKDDGRGGIRFGFLLILLGLLWLGGAVGWIREELIWPLTVLSFGLWLAVLSRIRWKRKR